jgi:flavin-dependent dehydrogenase
MTRVDDKSAIVTGGVSGSGKACARALAAAGASVTVIDVNAGRSAQVAGEIGGESLAVALARLDLDADILVNCAGVQHVAPVHEFPPEKFSCIVRRMLEPTGLSTPYPDPLPNRFHREIHHEAPLPLAHRRGIFGHGRCAGVRV